MIWSKVLLPEPDGPTTARDSPSATSSEMPSSTVKRAGPVLTFFAPKTPSKKMPGLTPVPEGAPYCLVTPFNCSNGGVGMRQCGTKREVRKLDIVMGKK